MVLTEGVLIYGTLNQLSKALSHLFFSHNVSALVELLSYQGLSDLSDVCYPEEMRHIQLQLEI